jgi:hypothetical protein
MAATWPTGVPFLIQRNGAAMKPGTRAARSDTDSGLARQKNVFSAAPRGIKGPIRMTWEEYEEFEDWRQALGGGAFNWPGHPSGSTVLARFVAGDEGEPQPDPATPKYLVPVSIEYL